MTQFIFIGIGLYGLIGLLSCLVGLRQSYQRQNPYGLTPWLLPYGSFVWGDAVLLGLFWTVVSVVCLWLNNVQLFLIIQAIFWMVRSAGEIIYWFLQQFATVKRDLPHTLVGHQIFPGESIWFAYQVAWQIVLVMASVFLTYLL